MSMTFIAFGLMAAAILFFEATRVTPKLATWNRAALYVMIAAIGLGVRLWASTFPYEHVLDLNCFRGWSSKLFADGTQGFYASDMFTDYPPGYMYVLTVVGAINTLFNIDNTGYIGTLIIKMPAILADVGLGLFIFWMAEKNLKRINAVAVSMLYLLNPAIILISACWGQVDSVHTLLVVVAVHWLTEKKLLKGSLTFVLAALVKPQALMFTPLFMFAYVAHWKESGFKKGVLGDLLINIMACLIFFIVLLLPFAPFKNWQFDLAPVLTQYRDTLASYAFATINAYNIYALFGLNWQSMDLKFLGITYNMWGMMSLVAIVLGSFVLLQRADKNSKSKYFYVAALINFSTFMFSVKMHERYSFPVIAPLLIAAMMKGDKRMKYLYGAVSGVFFLNYIVVLLEKGTAEWVGVISFLTVVVYVLATHTGVVRYKNDMKDPQEDIGVFGGIVRAFGSEAKPFAPEENEKKVRYTWHDFAVMAVITVVYAVVAFVNLGNTASPQSSFWAEEGQQIEVEFDQSVDWSRMQYFLGSRHDKSFTIEVSNGGGVWEEPILVETDSVFYWHNVEFQGTGMWLRLTMNQDDFEIMEMAVYNTNGARITPMRVDEGGEALFDEQNLVPERRSYMNGTYFDEIYHARTAYELEQGIKVYEWTHPPLGKVIIQQGIKLFGMTPFGWRVMGTLFGVLMLPLLYVFARRLFGKTSWAALATVLFAADFMHFAQTRIATIDTYITFFVIAMYYFMYKYYTMTFYTSNANEGDKAFRKTLIPLFLSGLCMGIGIACKWPGMYAGLGLAVLFVLTLIRRYREYDYAVRNRLQGNYRKFPKYAVYTCLWCLLFFLVIPAVIYVLSYVTYFFGTDSLYPVRESNRLFTEIPFFDAILPHNTFGTFIGAIVQNQRDIFGYHADLVSEHPFSSVWYEWIFNIRPIFYYSHSVSDTVRESMSAFGNPMVYWGGVVAMLTMFWKMWKSWDKKIIFLFIAYLAQLLPWMLVSRTTYAYHYFPCVPFLVLFIAYAARHYSRKKNRDEAAVEGDSLGIVGVHWWVPVAVAGVAIVLFAMFYPVLSGAPVSVWYVDTFLKWLSRWQLM